MRFLQTRLDRRMTAVVQWGQWRCNRLFFFLERSPGCNEKLVTNRKPQLDKEGKTNREGKPGIVLSKSVLILGKILLRNRLKL